MYEVNPMSILEGRKVTGLRVSPGEELLVVSTDGGEFMFETEGDCCSETWFADILGVDVLIGQTVTKVEEIDLPEPKDDRTRQDFDTAYGVRITTKRGVATIIYRNSSNGGYGGGICRVTLPDRRAKKATVEINADWMAGKPQ